MWSMGTRNPSSDGTVQQTDESLSWYDLMLAAVPLPMVVGAAAGAAGSLPPAGGLGVGALLSATVVAYGLFCDPPAA